MPIRDSIQQNQKTAVAATSNGQLQVIDHLDIDVYDFYCSGISFSNKES